MTQDEFSKKIGMARNSVGKYEIGINKPTNSVIVSICREFNVNEDWLRYGKGEMFRDIPTEEIDKLAERYGLPDTAKKIVKTFVELEEKEMNAILNFVEKLKSADDEMSATTYPAPIEINVLENNFNKDIEIEDMQVYEEYPVSAGVGYYLGDDVGYEIKPFPKDEIPKNTDYGIRVKGDSMEPEIANGSIVWVREQIAIDDGQIGIFILEGEALCKKLFINKKMKRVELVSLNPNYKNITVSEEDDFKTVGLVLNY